MIGYFLRLDKAQFQFLQNLPGPIVYHIRAAIADYIQKIKNQNVSSSASEMIGGDKNGQ